MVELPTPLRLAFDGVSHASPRHAELVGDLLVGPTLVGEPAGLVVIEAAGSCDQARLLRARAAPTAEFALVAVGAVDHCLGRLVLLGGQVRLPAAIARSLLAAALDVLGHFSGHAANFYRIFYRPKLI
jgi:hypothetical protein